MGGSVSSIARLGWALALLASHGAPGAAAPNCSIEALTVGSKVSGSKGLARLVKQHRYVLVGFSAKSCKNCCLWEPLYNKTLPLLPRDVFWARADVDRPESKALAAAHGIEDLPAVVLFHQRKAVQLHEVQGPRTLLALVERARTPVRALSSSDPAWPDWLNFGGAFAARPAGDGGDDLRAPQPGSRASQVVRVALLLDASADEDDLEELTEGARAFTGRPVSFHFVRASDAGAREELLRHPLVRASCGGLSSKSRAIVALSLFNGELIDPQRQRRGDSAEERLAVVVPEQARAAGSALVFNASAAGAGEASGLAVLPRIACRAFDAYDGLSLEEWVLRVGLPPVGRFDPLTSVLYERTQKPILMLFVDPARPELPSWLELLSAAHGRYNRGASEDRDALKLLFVYVDGLQFMHRMTSLGLAADPERLPAACFNFVNERVLTWQPPQKAYRNGSATFSAGVLDSLVQRYLYGEGSGAMQSEGAAPRAKPVPKRDAARGQQREVPDLASLSLEERLRFVHAVNQESFSEVVFDPSKDVVVYFYASKGKAAEASKERAIFVNRCSERFAELGLDTLRVTRLDTSSFAAPPAVLVPQVPSLLLFPAFSKDPPHLQYHGKFKVQHIMWWIEEHASRKFVLPDLPHLDEIEAKAYWEQKAQLSEERQRRVAADSERRPRRRRGAARSRRSGGSRGGEL